MKRLWRFLQLRCPYGALVPPMILAKESSMVDELDGMLRHFGTRTNSAMLSTILPTWHAG